MAPEGTAISIGGTGTAGAATVTATPEVAAVDFPQLLEQTLASTLPSQCTPGMMIAESADSGECATDPESAAGAATGLTVPLVLWPAQVPGTVAPAGTARVQGAASADVQRLSGMAAFAGTPQASPSGVESRIDAVAALSDGTLKLDAVAAPDPLAALSETTAFDARSASDVMTFVPAGSDENSTSSAVAQAHAGARTTVHQPQDGANALPRELRAPVGSPAWADELGERLTWMAHRGVDSAALRLSPEHLGPLEIRISVQDGQASVWFGAANADTRAALEQSLPRLREMLAAQGLVLADANVSREPPREHARTPGTAAAHAPIEANAESSTPVIARVAIGLLDTYA